MLVSYVNDGGRSVLMRYRIYCMSKGLIINGYSVGYSLLADTLMKAMDSKAKSGHSGRDGMK